MCLFLKRHYRNELTSKLAVSMPYCMYILYVKRYEVKQENFSFTNPVIKYQPKAQNIAIFHLSMYHSVSSLLRWARIECHVSLASWWAKYKPCCYCSFLAVNGRLIAVISPPTQATVSLLYARCHKVKRVVATIEVRNLEIVSSHRLLKPASLAMWRRLELYVSFSLHLFGCSTLRIFKINRAWWLVS